MIYECPYCNREMPSGIPDPAVWACCGEIGHARPRDPLERAASECDREADIQSAYAGATRDKALAVTHKAIAHTLMTVAQRIRAIK